MKTAYSLFIDLVFLVGFSMVAYGLFRINVELFLIVTGLAIVAIACLVGYFNGKKNGNTP